MSSIMVKKSGVLNVFLKARKKSKILPMHKPKIKNMIKICPCEKTYMWESPYLKIFPINPEAFFLSESLLEYERLEI